MKTTNRTDTTPSARDASPGDAPDPNAALEAARAEGARLHQIASAALRRVASQNAEAQLSTLRQRGGE